jgi:hypothetical protein
MFYVLYPLETYLLTLPRKQRKSSVTISGATTEIRTEFFANTRIEHYRCTNLLGYAPTDF